jgi:hypothetical protein
MVVLVIIGTIYALAGMLVRQPEEAASQAVRFMPDRLDRALRAVPTPGYIRLVCGGSMCETCQLEDFKGEPIGEPMPIFSAPPVRYDLKSSGSPQSIRAGSETPCFEMVRFENGAVSELLFEYENRFYHYVPLLRPAEIYSSLEAAWAQVDPYRQLPTDRSRYFHEEE